MDIHAHARPHLEVHSRSKGHSAVAGVAYRLGLRLYDERQKCWHDFQKRVLGEEIVRALTVAPKGSPSWCTDPQQLWNRVERAERRSDSQVARDYRIPIPFGLSDQDAGDLAEEMARFISSELNTPVSLGLHRDADRDALGNLKPNDKQGFHAHLYFPTRPLADLDEDGGKEGKGAGFGPKLYVFSKMHLGSAFIELLNCKWSELANDYARKVGSSSKYEYKSYKRLGVSLVPQPTLGQSATALERRGITTHRGDSLREAMVMATVYEKAHEGALEAQHRHAMSDVAREGGKTSERPTRVLSKHVASYFKNRKAVGSGQLPVSRQGSLAYRLRSSAPTPATKEEYEELERSLVLVEALDTAFASYHQLQNELDEVLRIVEATRAASLDAKFKMDGIHEKQKVATVRLRRWEDENRWRIKFFASFGGAPLVTHEKLRKGVQLHADHVQALKSTIVSHDVEVADVEKKAGVLKAKVVEVLASIRNILAKLHDMASSLLPDLMKALPESSLALAKEQLPVLFPDAELEAESKFVSSSAQVGKNEGTPSKVHEVPDASHPSLQAKPSF